MRRRNEIKIYPIDTEKSKAVGVALPFNGIGIFKLNYTTRDQVKTNLTNFMLTNPGERVFNVDYGAGLRDLVFDQGGRIEEVRARVEDRIRTYFPQITLISLDFDRDNTGTELFINLRYFFNKKEDNLLIQMQTNSLT